MPRESPRPRVPDAAPGARTQEEFDINGKGFELRFGVDIAPKDFSHRNVGRCSLVSRNHLASPDHRWLRGAEPAVNRGDCLVQLTLPMHFPWAERGDTGEVGAMTVPAVVR
jgi:hypothetical protein